jgi:membrane-bound lytic murein transglycosylase D
MTNRLAPAAVLLLLAACSPGASRAPATAPAPVAAVPVVAPDTVDSGPELETEELKDASSTLLGNVRYDMPMEANTWVATELDFLVKQRKAVVGRWLERAEPYQEFVKGVFVGYGLPTDLHHLAMVESGFIPTARSHAGAVGLWQFMPATGRGMGLRIDDMVDERMDPVRSTHAAARHLRDLHRTFGGDWSLAAAAYNAGTGRISRGMQGIGAKNFWELAVWGTLAQETRQYVPRLYAVTIIARDRERFGFSRPQGLVKPFAYDSIQTDLSIPLAELAMMANLPALAVAQLNPHLHRGMTPAGNYWVWVPRGSGPALQQAYMSSEVRRDGGYGSYAVRRGDSAEKLALVAGMTISRIRELNPSVDLEKLPNGARLRLPRAAAATLAARPVERVAARDSDAGESRSRERGEERGKGDRGSEPRKSERGERSSSRSRRESASTERSSERESSSSRKSGEGASSSSSSERRREGRTTEHKVADGETLWALSRKFEVSVDEIREANDLEGDVIVPGRTLRIPRKSAASEERSERSSSSTARTARRGEESSSTRKDGDSEERAERSSSSSSSSTTRTARRSEEPSSTRKAAASEERSERSSSSTRTARRGDESSSTRKDGDSGETTGRSSERPSSSTSRTARRSEESSSTRKDGDSRKTERESASSSSSSSSSSAASRGSRSSEKSVTRTAAREHVVKNGETLWGIARMYDSTVVAIQRANDMVDDSPIRAGQKLRIPR